MTQSARSLSQNTTDRVAYPANTDFSRFWRLGNPGSTFWLMRYLVKALFQNLLFSLYKGTAPIMRTPPPLPNRTPAPSQRPCLQIPPQRVYVQSVAAALAASTLTWNFRHRSLRTFSGLPAALTPTQQICFSADCVASARAAGETVCLSRYRACSRC